MYQPKSTAIIGLFLLMASALFGQELKPKFGKVSMEELQMTSYDKDTTANGVILFNIGSFDPNSYKFTRHMRIKILKKSGLAFGNWSFNTSDNADFNVVVTNLENGEPVKVEAGNDNIYKEQVIDDYYIYKVFAPKVQVGSVIDVRYSFYGMPYEWDFQFRIPTVYSEIEIPDNKFFSFNRISFGYEPIVQLNTYRWASKDVPAFVSEPFISDPSNYMTKFSLYRVGAYVKTDWQFFINRMLEWSDFGNIFTTSTYINKYAKSIQELNLPVVDQINAAYDTIQSNIKWSGRKTTWASKDIVQNFKVNHSGSSADINLLLICLLKKLNITTHPVILSTRDNGLMLRFVPNINQPNYVIAYVEHEGTNLLIDATSEHLRPGILPPYCLNGEGLIVEKDKVNWIPLNAGHFSDSETIMSTVTIKESLTASANITRQCLQYSFYNWCVKREELDDDNEKIAQILEGSHDNIDVLSYQVKDVDKSKFKSNEVIELDVTEQLVDVGDGYIYTPISLFDFKDNPFKSEDRKYPVDFIYPVKRLIMAKIVLPKDAKVVSLPKSISLSTQAGTARFIYGIAEKEGEIQISVNLNISKSLFLETEYPEFRQFFSEVVKKVNEPIQFQK